MTMNKFGYNLNKYLSYRKATRDDVAKDRLDSAIEELKHKEINLKGYEECLLSDNAKRMLHDLEKHINDNIDLSKLTKCATIKVER